MQPFRYFLRLNFKHNPMRLITLLLLFIAVNAGLAQTQEIKAPNFNEINIFGPFKVKLVKAAASRAEIDYNGVDAADVIIKSGGEELQIKIRNNSLFDFNDRSNRKGNRPRAIVTIYYTSLERIEIRGGASLHAADPIVSPKLALVSSMGSEVRLQLQVKKLNLESSMGSEVELSGTADEANIKAKMGTDIDASQLRCQEVTVSASMGADVRVFAEKELNASANFGASISCKGNPAHKHTSGFFGADVN